MDDLRAKRREAETRKLFLIRAFRHAREVVEYQGEAGVSPAVECADTGKSEHREISYGSNSIREVRTTATTHSASTAPCRGPMH